MLIEIALVLPLLLALTLGLIEYGWLFLKDQAITNAARQGARIGVLPYSTNADALASITQLMTSAGLAGSGYTVTFTPSNVATVPPNQTVRVEISVPYANIALINLPLVPVPTNLRAVVIMAKEGA